MIEIHDLSLQYQGSHKPALQGINLYIQKGSFFGLLGPNGAGKTSLLSILSGHITHYTGSASIGGTELNQSDQSWKSKISLIPQEYAFYDKLSAWENLLLFSRVLGMNKRQSRENIERVSEITQLGSHIHRQSNTLSGGLKRRLNLAIGLLNKPTLIMLDEPTVGIDPHSRHFILETLHRLSKQGTTLVYTSHYMEEIESICTDIGILDNGNLLVQEQIQELINKKQHQRLHIKLKAPLNSHHLQSLGLDTTTYAGKQELVKYDIDEYQVANFLRKLHNLGIHYEKLSYGSQSLEEAFLSLTKRTLRDGSN